MELGLQCKDICYYEPTGGITSAHEESLETAIPEYCPDITRVVDTTGRLIIREKVLHEGRCTVSGSVKVTVLYTSEEATGLRSLSMSVPFSCTIDDRALERCGTVCASGRVLLAEARAVTSRKLYMKVLPEITVVGYQSVKRRICCGTQEEPTLRRRFGRLEMTLLSTVSEKGFSFTQDVLLEKGQAPEDLLLHRLCPTILSAQRLGNKLMVKGEVWLSALYRGEDQMLRQYTETLPFSQILEAAELPETAEYTLRPGIGECDVRLLRTENGCGFGLTARIDVCVLAYQRWEGTLLEDVYSIRYDTAVERQAQVFQMAEPERMAEREAQLRLEFQGHEPFISVTGVECAPVEVLPEEGKTTLRTTLHVRLLYLDESGAPVSTERTAEVSTEVEAVSGAVTVCCCRSQLQWSGDTCLIRLPVTFCMGCGGEKTVDSIVAVNLTEPDSAPMPSLVLCRMAPQETLWDVAKRYRTDEEAIRSANQLENDAEAGKRMLLIPRIR